MNPVIGLSLGRIALGAGALVAPVPTAKLFGLDPVSQPQVEVITRMFGAREVAVGVATLLSKGALRRNLTLLGMAVDAADAATGVAALQAGRVSRSDGLGLAGIAGGAVLAGAVAVVTNRGA
ncbi:MAG TPA: hypothetical protein VNS81_11115 [Nocardioides sp.]|nr:hypothetical protein [Nocardioides sp.]